MQRRIHKIDDRLVRRLLAHACDLAARLLLFAAPEINKDHQHPRLDQLWIELECLLKSFFRALVILRAAQATKDSIDVTRPKAIVRERERGIKLDGALEMCYGRIAIFGRDRAKDKTAEEIAPAQELFVSRRNLRRAASQINLLVRAQLYAQAVNDALRDGVL